ncbi:MAG: hypothetical protein WA741_00630 [Candidatus Sulfotelmatobacter sp.]
MGHSVRKRSIEERLVALFLVWRRINLCRHWTAKDLGMTLAAILLVGMVCAPPWAPAARRQDAPQSAPATKPPEAATTGQGTAQAAQNPPAPSQTPPATAKTSSGETHTTTPQSHHKKRALPPCDAPAAAQPPAGSNPTPADSAAAGTAQTSKTPSPCPPSKVVVRQGGTSEPSIELAGGAANQTAHQRDVANQILGSANANLKKIAGHPLSAGQQDMVNQVRQFMGQSKAAIDAGDLERARTLAWKAEVLSEELVKPEK